MRAQIPLGELMVSRAGSIDPAKFAEEVFELYSIPAFDTGIPDVVAGSSIGSTKQIVQPNDVLLSKIVPHIRRAWVVGERGERRLIASGEWIVFRSDSFEPRYLRHLLVSDAFHKQFMQTVSGVGGSLLRARPAHVANISVALPSLAEQRRIAEVLDRAEALRTKRRAALAELDALAEAMFLEMFGDPVANPRQWPVRRIGQLGTVITGNTPPRFDSNLFGNRIEWIKSDNINTPADYLTSADEGLSEAGMQIARIAPAGSILVTCIAGSPGSIGNAAMADRDVAFNQQINAIVPVQVETRFLYAQIVAGKRLIQQASTGGMKGLVSKSRLEQVEFMMPPRPLQCEFARRVAVVDQLKAAQRASLAELDALFASMQHRAFRGEL